AAPCAGPFPLAITVRRGVSGRMWTGAEIGRRSLPTLERDVGWLPTRSKVHCWMDGAAIATYGHGRIWRRVMASSRKYSKSASRKVAKVMRERKRGTLRSGSSGKKVTSRKQAIAIGLSEARRAGARVPSQRASRKKK